MKFLDRKEGARWAHDVGWVDLEPNPEILSDKFNCLQSYLVPHDSGRKTALARMIANIVSESKVEGVLWISNFSPWESSENRELFYGYRRSLGESRSLHEVPYHQFGIDDYVALECLLDLVLYFVWDAILIDARNKVAFQFSHDEWFAAATYVSQSLDALRRRFEEFQLEPHPHDDYEDDGEESTS